MRGRTLLPAVLIGVLGALPASPAGATVPDLFGMGGRYPGMGGGGVAMVDDGPSPMMNPAGLSRMRQPTAELGFSVAAERFAEVPDLWWDTNRDGVVDERDPPLEYDAGVDNAYGIHFALGRHVGGKFGLGLAGYVPADRLLRFKTFEPTLPNYVMYDNRPQRYALAMGVGGEVLPGVNIGMSVDFVPRARLEVLMTADGSVTGEVDDQGEIEDLLGQVTIDVHELSLDLVPGFAPIVGLQLELGDWVEALEGLVVGGMYRHEVGLPIEVVLDAQFDVAVGDVGDLEPFVLALVADAGLALFDHYVPRTAAVGVAWRTEKTLSAYGDLRWTDWSGNVLNVAQLEYAEVQSPLVDIDDEDIVDGNAYEAVFRPTVGLRAGVELALPRKEYDNAWRYLQVSVRGGFGYEPTPLVEQGTSSALLDSDRLMFTVGAGVETWDPKGLIDAPVRVDVFGQYHALARGVLPRAAEQPTAGYPREGDGIPFGGDIFVVGGQIAFQYN